MDLRTYYRKIRELSDTLPDPAVVVSRATPDGGVPGRLTEAPREVAARLIFDGFAELADDAQAAAFRQEAVERKAAEEARRAAAGKSGALAPALGMRRLAPPPAPVLAGVGGGTLPAAI